MRKRTFLKLCGERDRSVIAGETPPEAEDLLRLEYLAELLGCLEVELTMYIVRHEQAPTAEGARDPSTETRWRQQFLCDAPDAETLYLLLKQKEARAVPSMSF